MTNTEHAASPDAHTTDDESPARGSAAAVIATAYGWLASQGRGLRGHAAQSMRNRRQRAAPTEPASPANRTIALILTMITATIAALIATLLFVSPLQYVTAQTALYKELRLTLAEGSTPTGPLDSLGVLVELGTPLAVFAANDAGVSRSVVVEGTGAAQTMQGIGHRRDTVMPCQAGTSVLMARSGAYGAVGAGFKRLERGDSFSVTMAQGTCVYRVADVRMAGDPAPAALQAGQGRLTLVTAAGPAYQPTEVYRVDAEVVGTAFPASPTQLAAGSLPASEAAMGSDSGNLTALILLLQAIVGSSLAVTWMWRRWGVRQAWISGVPLLAALVVVTATTANQWLLPNLL